MIHRKLDKWGSADRVRIDRGDQYLGESALTNDLLPLAGG